MSVRGKATVPGSKRPNFLFITTDQQRWDALRCAGNSTIRTPNLDRLASEGIRFDRAYPSNPICMPARATMITGRSQRGHQVFDHEINLSESIPVLGDSLRAADYRTVLFGKAHFKIKELEDNPPSGAERDPRDGLWHGPYYGFEHVTYTGGHWKPSGHWRHWLEREHPEGIELWDRASALAPSTLASSWKNAIPKEWHHTQWFTDLALDWLRKYDGARPFFLWLSFSDPHEPFCPPRPYCDMYDPDDMPPPIPPDDDLRRKPPQYRWAMEGSRTHWGGVEARHFSDRRLYGEVVAHYYGMVTFIDDMVGRVLDELERLGLADSTHVIFTSDHGEALADHMVMGKPPLAYESVIRVPMIWRHEPSIPAGRVHEGVMTHVDLVPTILDLADAPPLPGMEGRSFATLLHGRTDAHRDAVVIDRISLERHTTEPVIRLKMLVTQRWKLVHYGPQWPGELYDLANDPHEFENLWADPAHVRKRQELTDQLLSEIIADELGDVGALFQRQLQQPMGAMRDPDQIEPTLGYRQRSTNHVAGYDGPPAQESTRGSAGDADPRRGDT